MFMGCDEEASLLLTLYKAIGAPKSRRADVKILIRKLSGSLSAKAGFNLIRRGSEHGNVMAVTCHLGLIRWCGNRDCQVADDILLMGSSGEREVWLRCRGPGGVQGTPAPLRGTRSCSTLQCSTRF